MPPLSLLIQLPVDFVLFRNSDRSPVVIFRSEDMSRFLFVAEGHDGIEGGSAARGDDGSRERNKNYAEQSEQKRDHIAGLDAKEHGAHEACARKSNRNASEDGSRADQQTFAQNQPQHLPVLCAEGHADADFRSAAADAIGERAVEAGGDKEDSKYAEEDR